MKKARQPNKKARAIEKARYNIFSLNSSIAGILLAITCFAVLGFLIYFKTFDAPFVFDDINAILDNSNIRMQEITASNIIDAAFGLSKNRPLPKLSFAFNYYFGHYNPAGYHLVNIIIHIINGILLFFFLKLTCIILKAARIFQTKIYLLACLLDIVFHNTYMAGTFSPDPIGDLCCSKNKHHGRNILSSISFTLCKGPNLPIQGT
jgi:hypothetical protein